METLRFRRPRLLQSALLLRIAAAAVLVPSGLLAVGGPAAWQEVPGIVGACLALLIAVVLFRVWRARTGLPPIIVTDDALHLPPSQDARRTVRVPLKRVRSAAVLGNRWFPRLVIDAGWRQFSYPHGLLAEPDAVVRLQAALRTRLAALADGSGLAEAMDERHRLAAELRHRHPYGTWGAVALLAAAFALQAAARPAEPLGLLHLGANAPILVRAGQWFRLVTANLLHLSPYHLLANAGALLIYGSFVERLAGFRRTALVLLATGILSHAISAALGLWLQRHLFSVGTSGAIFGLLGALGAIIWRFAHRIPGGLRPPGPAWWILLVGYAAAVAILVPRIDTAAQAGGALAGLALGAVVCGACPTTHALRRPSRAVTVLAAVLALAWTVGIGFGLVHAMRPAGRLADETLLAQGALALAPALQNDIAWDVATDRTAGPAQLRPAAELAQRAATAAAREKADDRTLTAYIDTSASLQYRLGAPGRAMRLELPLIGKDPTAGAHFALFLDRALRQDGPQVVGDAGPASPTLSLAGGVLHLAVRDEAPNGGRVYAVVRRADVLAGMLTIPIPPHFSGLLSLTLPGSLEAPRSAPPAEFWSAGSAAIEFGLFDRRGCACEVPAPGPWFTSVDLAADLPPPGQPTPE